MNKIDQEITSESSSGLSIIEQQERASIDMLIATAKKYPRDILRVKRNMEVMATLDQDTAEACNYHLERGGKAIDGPSVRLAEIAVANYQNIRCGARVVANDGKTITGQAFCHDLENNTFIAWESARRITDSTGRLYSDDMQVVTGNAASAIAFRNAVFKVIPGALIKPVAEKAKQMAVGDLKTLSERRTRALKKFAAIGVTEDRVLSFLKRADVGQIVIGDVEKLFGVYTAIREGSTTIEEQFPRVVKPNLGQAERTEPDDIPMGPRRPGRPRKAQPISKAEESPKVPAGDDKPAGAMAKEPEPVPEADEAVSAILNPVPQSTPSQSAPPEPATPPTELFESGPTSFSPVVHDVTTRLASEGITHQRFLLAMHSFGMVDADPSDIKMGYFLIGQVQEKYLHAALKDWKTLLENLPE